MAKTKKQSAPDWWSNRIVNYGEQPANQFLAHELNARRHPGKQRDALRGSLNAVGWVAPVIVSKRTSKILDGHARVEEALSQDESSLVPFVEVDVSENEERTILATFDPITGLAVYERDALDALLREVDTGEAALQETLSELAAREGLYLDEAGAMGDPSDAEPQIDRAAELNKKWKVKTGDLWLIGNHRLLCGDSTNAGDVARVMGGEKAEMVWTDPPYNLASHSKLIAAVTIPDSYGKLKDSDWDKDFSFQDVAPSFDFVLGQNCAVYICTSQFIAGVIWTWMQGWADFYNYVVWCKTNPMPSLTKRHWTWGTEIICYATRGKHCFNFPSDGHALNWWNISAESHQTSHPTEKPVSVPLHAINASSKKGGLIADLFAGSGTTLVAAQNLNRRCYAIEISPDYCAVILERMSQAFPDLEIKRDA